MLRHWWPATLAAALASHKGRRAVATAVAVDAVVAVLEHREHREHRDSQPRPALATVVAGRRWTISPTVPVCGGRPQGRLCTRATSPPTELRLSRSAKSILST